MADLLLELFSEEIPARMQKDALGYLTESIKAKAAQHGFNAGNFTGYVTPRRLAVWVKDLPLASAATETELKGPKIGAPDAAMQGFLKKTGLSKEQLTEKDGAYFAIVKKDGQQTADVLKTIIEETLAAFPWPKSMRWGSGDQTWVRPLHSIMCLFDGKIIDVAFAGVHGGHMTYGHRFLARDSIMFTSGEDYEKRLYQAYVLVDRDKRKAEILKQAQAAADKAGLVLKQDEGLLEEVTGLVEWPTVLVGTIDAQFMDLPKEVLVSEMRAHQKYFALENKDGSLSDKFLITSNMITNDEGKAIIAGNERVLRARLADGRFFWDQDRKKALTDWAENLKSVTYHAKLGTIADKVERVTKLAVQLADIVKADKKQVERASRLAKADLTSGMVGEFPELQGVMGRYYAQAQKEDAAVADAIRDHYLPLGPTTPVPTDKVGICVALADKLDTLVSMFAIGEKPTGSKDPFALRRAALGVIRIILENKLRLSFRELLDGVLLNGLISAVLHANDAFKCDPSVVQNIKISFNNVSHTFSTSFSVMRDAGSLPIPGNIHSETIVVKNDLINFFIDRLKVQLKDSGIRHDVIAAVIAPNENGLGDDDLVRIVERAKAVQEFLATEDGANLLAGYKRAANILTIEEKKDGTSYNQPVDSKLSAAQAEESAFATALTQSAISIESYLATESYTEAMRSLSKLRAPVDHFFDKVLVNSDDKAVRANRLRLLSQLRTTLDKIANFSLVEGDVKEQKKKAA